MDSKALLASQGFLAACSSDITRSEASVLEHDSLWPF